MKEKQTIRKKNIIHKTNRQCNHSEIAFGKIYISIIIIFMFNNIIISNEFHHNNNFNI
jgi:hypothetical protein